MDKLIKVFTEGKKKGYGYVYVVANISGNRELIVNPVENVDAKLDYYRVAYTENLELRANSNIKIEQYGWAATLGDIDREAL